MTSTGPPQTAHRVNTPMSPDSLREPARFSDDDALRRLAALDHSLHQISTQLTPLSKLLSQLDELCATLTTLIGSLESASRS
ncbi:MAG TPA: hypothetical protein VK784_03715 [Pseudonocardiaceae bacterium]|jgi:hypothetical protein|nr:hypothetical protein [Pseudonocardiaceae bacterium]